MRNRLALFAFAFVAFAACGDDNNPAGTDVCGDGNATGNEECDDGNTNAGDGCSAACRNESSGVCGDTMVTGTEQCDDGNTNAGDGCSATCQNETNNPCGNGAIDGAEACDDGNTANSDGCSATCVVEQGYVCTGAPSVCTMATGSCTAPFIVTLTDNAGTLEGTATGSTTTSTDQVAMASCEGDPNAGAGKDHIYQFTLTDARDVAVSLTDATVFDSVVRVMSAPCTVATEIPEFRGEDGCSDQGLTMEEEQLIYVALTAGTYYIVVDGYDTTDEGNYTLTVSAAPTTCGNGTVDVLEICDDNDLAGGDGCDAHCEQEPGYTCTGTMPSVCTMTCGNGTLDTGETCDDANPTATDGCSATCQTETGYTCTGTGAGSCTLNCGNGTFDLGEECEDGGLANGDRCSSTCTLESDVTETEPNDTTAQPLTITNNQIMVRGAIAAGDVDLFSFTLTNPARVEMQTYNAMDNIANYSGVPTTILNVDCYGALAYDPILRVFPMGADVTMNTLAIYGDDDDGDEFCPYIGEEDPTDPDEGVLQPGTYIIKLQHVGPTGTLPHYILDLKITPAVSPIAGDIVVNEVLSNDGIVDANCDGAGTTTANTDDEFVEIVNVSNKFIDLTGVTIADIAQLRHTFAATATSRVGLLPGDHIVVYGGGAPACAGVNSVTANASGVQLGLNNGGDSVIVSAPGIGAPLVTFVVGNVATADAGRSFNLDPDLTGNPATPVFHDLVLGAVGNLSPGLHSDGFPF